MYHILNGIRVLDLGRFISAPYCGMMLADMGAEVIKIERKGGEDGRELPPFAPNGESLYVPSFNRNKKGITLNTRSEQGKALLRSLIEKSDVLIENFRPGVMVNMGLSYEEIEKINPRMIMVSISGYGQKGSYAQRGAFDMIVQATSGMMSVTGTPESGPVMLGTPFVDHLAGLFAPYGIMLALYDRQRTGKGKYLDLSMMDCAVPMLQTVIPAYSVNKTIPGRHGCIDPLTCPVNRYQAKDGYVMIHAGTDPLFARLITVIQDEQLKAEKYQDVKERIADRQMIDKVISGWCMERNAEDIDEILTEAGIPCGVVNDIKQIFENPIAVQRDQLIEIGMPGIGKVHFGGNPVKFSQESDGTMNRAPYLGEHNVEIYHGLLGIGMEEIQNMERNDDI